MRYPNVFVEPEFSTTTSFGPAAGNEAADAELAATGGTPTDGAGRPGDAASASASSGATGRANATAIMLAA